MSKISNSFFNSIIKDYVDKNKFENIDELCDVDIRKRHLCKDSKIASQFLDIDFFSNKKKQYESVIKYLGKRPEYLPETIMFNKNNINKLMPYFNKNKWIIKPENSLARKGVKVVNNYKDLYDHVIKSKYNEWICQEYIENPLLIDKKKFHFRLYVLIIKSEKKFEIYTYNKGFMYFSKLEYSKDTINKDSHLSGESSKNHVKVFPEDFFKHFSEKDYFEKIVPQFKNIAKETVLANYDNIQCINYIKNHKCFKFLGYDILIDKDFKCYLAEINARLISLKYPPENFKEDYYTSILDCVLKNKCNNFELVYDKEIKEHIEHFTNKNNFCFIKILVFLIVVLILLTNFLI